MSLSLSVGPEELYFNDASELHQDVQDIFTVVASGTRHLPETVIKEKRHRNVYSLKMPNFKYFYRKIVRLILLN